jgi:hypothetical protein
MERCARNCATLDFTPGLRKIAGWFGCARLGLICSRSWSGNVALINFIPPQRCGFPLAKLARSLTKWKRSSMVKVFDAGARASAVTDGGIHTTRLRIRDNAIVQRAAILGWRRRPPVWHRWAIPESAATRKLAFCLFRTLRRPLNVLFALRGKREAIRMNIG